MLDATDEPVARTRVVNGVAVPGTRFDPDRDTDPNHERTAIEALRRYVRRGDRVVVVGGGWGTTAVVAARMTHYEGDLTVYEPSSKMRPILERTLAANDVAEMATVVPGAVGPVSDSSERLFGAPDGTGAEPVEAVEPAALPRCDVLDVDCEGAELAVLRGIECRPRVVVVEAHPHLGCPPEMVESELRSMGYDVVDREPADAPEEITNLVGVLED